jgi:hypothetical protein
MISTMQPMFYAPSAWRMNDSFVCVDPRKEVQVMPTGGDCVLDLSERKRHGGAVNGAFFEAPYREQSKEHTNSSHN